MPTHFVPYVPQSERLSCWAAATAMMLSFRRGQSVDEQEVLDEFAHFGTDGAQPEESLELSRAVGLEVIHGQSLTHDGWREFLVPGPLMVGVPNHWIVVSGYDGEGDLLQLYVLDPDTSVGEGWQYWRTVERKYEASPEHVVDLMRW